MGTPYVVSMIALAWGIGEEEVLPMLVRWREEPLTLDQIVARLGERNVPASPQRLSELIREHQGTERGTRRKEQAKP